MTELNRTMLRRYLEGVLRLAECDGAGVAGQLPSATTSSDGGRAVEAGLNVVVLGDGITLPPLTQWQQLFLSAVLGEPIPPIVLLCALEDAGIYPNGVIAAAQAAVPGGTIGESDPT